MTLANFFNCSIQCGLCNIGPDFLQKPQDKMAWVLATMNGSVKVLLV